MPGVCKMGIFKKNNAQEKESKCEYDVINLNHYALSKDTITRRNQLSALFVLLKNKYPDAEYSITTPLKEFNIPEEFEGTEIIAIAKYFEATEWHLFIDEERYADISFEKMEINGEPEMLEFYKKSVMDVEKFGTDLDVYDFSFNKYPGWLWEKYLEEQYMKMTALGNRYLKYGDFYVYDEELDEHKITCVQEFEKARNREYILLKSKLTPYKVIFVDLGLKQVLATELDDLEKEYFADILHPTLNE